MTHSNPNSTKSPQDILQTIFGFEHFRGHQQDVIDCLLDGKDVLAIMPTGSGKSLCYQIPALLRDGVGVVISPLIALMQNQVDALSQLGIKAAFLNSTLDWRQALEIETQVRRGEIDLLYVAPERLTTERCLALLKESRLALFAIDEAHCVSQWGHDFRPDYMGLAVLAEHFPGVPRIALTATADEITRREIIDKLKLGNPKNFLASFDRPNIFYRVALKNNARQQLLQFLKDDHHGHSGIVYCLSRKKTEEIAEWMRNEGFNALAYHAGLEAHVRKTHLERFLREDDLVMVATIAFGMGIDKPDVRFVAHLDLPKSVEAYYQETGRAGRDGEAADAWMAYGLGDVVTHRQMLNSSNAPDAQKRIENIKLNAMLGYCETTKCRRQVLLAYFGETMSNPCGHCDTCQEPVVTWDGTLAAQKALSCIYRTGQRFGAGHLIDVLLGKDTERTRSFGHDKLPTFGVGKELSNSEWHSVMRQLIAMGFVAVDTDGYGGLFLGESSRGVLKGEAQIRLRKDPPRTAKKSRREKFSTPATDNQGPIDAVLWEAMRSLRAELARTQGVPPYFIFHDATLKHICLTRPTTLQDMRAIPGVGEKKFELYAEKFWNLLKASAPS